MTSLSAELARLAKQRLAELEAEVSALRTVIAVYEGGDVGNPALQSEARRTSKSPLGGGTSSRRKAASDDWRDIFRHVSSRGVEGMHLDAIEEYSKLQGYEHDRGRLRSQMHNWKTRGWLESPAQSTFVATHAGREALGSSNEEGADSRSAPSSEIESEPRDQLYEAKVSLGLLNPDERRA